MRWTRREVPTSHGPARLHRAGTAPAGTPTLVLGHGAGGGVDAPDLQAVARAVVAAGFAVVLVEQPWRVAGGRLAPRPTALDEAWCQAVAAIRLRGPLVTGGRSAGARVACRTAAVVGAHAVVALAFPLHPPGRPERSRAEEGRAVRVPLLIVQGARDPFGTAEQVRRALPRARVHAVPGGDHSLSRGDLGPALNWVGRLLEGCRE
jgi:uncharacterized protein